MNKVVKGSFELMKQLNIAAILKVVRDNKGLSRADIAKLTGLTPASITNITKFLLEDKYLIESKIGESSGGRPPIILEINPNARYIIGVSIGIGNIEVVITNLNANIRIKKTIIVSDERYNKELIFDELIKLINEVVEESEINRDDILGIGIALHGIVNAKDGISKYSPYYRWENVDIKGILEEKLNYPVYVDNDVRAMAMGESLFGISKRIANFITISISNGVGAGIIIGNNPYYGVDYSAGEIGHIIVEGDGDKCNCGNYGCLETVASNSNIVRKIIKLIKQGENSMLINMVDNINDITISHVCNAASLGDELSIHTLREAARYIGTAVTSLINILNPTAIVVVGEIFENTTYALQSLEEIVKKRALKLPAENVRIIKSNLGKDAAVIGAATLVIQELFNGNNVK